MSGRAKDIELLAGEYGTDEAGAERLYEEGIRPSGAASHDFVPADPAHDEFVKDRVCPRCSSRLKLDRKDNYIYCSSDTCPYFQALPFTASQLKVTGGENPTSPTNNMGGGIISLSPPVAKQQGGREMEEEEKIRKDLEYLALRGEKWSPAPGESLIGEVIKKDEPIVGRAKDESGNIKDKKNQLIVVKDKNGKLWTVWKSKATDELFAKVKIGDTVGLKFIGKQNIKTGGTFKKIEYVLSAKQG